MRYLAIALVLAMCGQAFAAPDAAPAAEKYLHSGELVKGQQELERALAAAPKDDQLRFGLGVLRFVRGVERLGQSFHEYGLKSEHQNAPLIRLPVPHNPEPAVIRYEDFRRILDDFRRDLMDAEEVLDGVTDDRVVLPLHLADIHLDLDGDGKASDRFVDILTKLMRGQSFGFLKDNPSFLVRFDRGDVAWLQAYCHLLSGMLDFYLAFDTKADFELWADTAFAKPKVSFTGTQEERLQKTLAAGRSLRLAEPARLSRFRGHLIKIAELNRESWRYIRSETDNNYEWLPNAKQQSVLQMPVRDNMIDAWLAALTEIEALLEGKKLMFTYPFQEGGKGINMKLLLEDPPAEIDWDKIVAPDAKYMEKGKFVDVLVLLRVMQVFENPSNVGFIGYAAWFN
ncbi:MAG: hypothetical protein IAF94_16860 [Pirellulaceae bacterium]|nr:hypothetical protein [Pirellulaceae bacterium]